MPDRTPVTIERHAPEHGGSSMPGPAPAGCCCCCCCLHTIGGLLGAIQGSITSDRNRQDFRGYHSNEDSPYDRYGRDFRRDDIDAPFPFRRDQMDEETPLMPVQVLYWLLVLFLCAVTSFLTYLNNGARDPGTLIMGGFIAAMILPALQLGASLITAILVLIFYPDKKRPLTRIGKITLWSFGGAAIGLLAMGGCCGAFWALGVR